MITSRKLGSRFYYNIESVNPEDLLQGVVKRTGRMYNLSFGVRVANAARSLRGKVSESQRLDEIADNVFGASNDGANDTAHKSNIQDTQTYYSTSENNRLPDFEYAKGLVEEIRSWFATLNREGNEKFFDNENDIIDELNDFCAEVCVDFTNELLSKPDITFGTYCRLHYQLLKEDLISKYNIKTKNTDNGESITSVQLHS